MRTIKFKGQRKDNKEWVKGDYVSCLSYSGETFLGYSYSDNGGVINNVIIQDNVAYEINPKTLCEYIDITFEDKNESYIETYEGDIIRWCYTEDYDYENNTSKKWNYDTIDYKSSSGYPAFDLFKGELSGEYNGIYELLEYGETVTQVVGNIHDYITYDEVNLVIERFDEGKQSKRIKTYKFEIRLNKSDKEPIWSAEFDSPHLGYIYAKEYLLTKVEL